MKPVRLPDIAEVLEQYACAECADPEAAHAHADALLCSAIVQLAEHLYVAKGPDYRELAKRIVRAWKEVPKW